MKNIQYTFVLMMILLAVPAMCQKRSGELEFPVLLDMSQDISKNFRDFEKDMADLEFLEDKFYPIGWSKDGKFAYFVEPADEACGCYFGTFVIQDLKTDKVLWQHRHVSDEMGSVGDEKEFIIRERKELWASKNAEFVKKLKAFGIEAAPSFLRKTGPLKTKDDELTFRLELTRTDAAPQIGFPYNLVKMVGKARSAKKGEKVIFEETLEGDDTLYGINGAIAADFFGYLLSPYEARAAVIMVEIVRGYEGPPHTTRTSVVGVDLTSGFKR